MTIEKGEPWGSTFDGPPPQLTAVDDAHLARLAHEHRSAGDPPLILVGRGDVAATIGADTSLPDGDHHSARLYRYPMDLGYVELGHRSEEAHRTVPFAAHVLGRRRTPVSPWPELIVMNTPLASGLRLGPRGHPNDGRLDVTVGRLPWRQGREARRRAMTGDHLPHPRLETRRRTEAAFSLGRRVRITVDGVDHGHWSRLAVAIVPDAYVLVARVA